ncbi:hypothetical protein BGZ98_000494 [Dissophora globulifera]|nr:hypothetical protein BGZ98_000494 [Dissophora globulifera]
MLRFFTMSIKLFSACLIPGLFIILPINTYSTNDGRLFTGLDDGNDLDPSLPNSVPRQGTSLLYLFTQFIFTWIFSLLTIYASWRTYEGYIDVRRRYLLKRRKAIVNRTIMVIGLPSHLQSDRTLATFYESLGVGTVESAHVCRHVTKLKRLIEQRAYALRALELVYTEYYGNPSGRPDYDPDQIAAENDRTAEQIQQQQQHQHQQPEHPYQNLNGDRRNKRRPMVRLGWLGLFGKKVDKIDYQREIFATLDKAVQKMRMSRVFATTSIGFVTFEDTRSAQILAQTVNTQETLSCETFLAPEPRDVYWDNLNLPPSELDVRTVVINVIVFFLVFFWAGPVSIFSSFLNLDSLNKIFPGISRIAGKNALLKSLIQGFLPTVGVIIFLAVVPRILIALCRRQGIQSHSGIAQSLYNKYFTFILFNVVLVFTIVGTWAQAFNKVYHNVGELTLLLAVSLPRVAPFFVNYTILRGIGLFPLQLLQIADVFNLILQHFISKTPRDYAEARAPPQLSYGVIYANATLVFVVVLIYSCIRPMILIFGVIYFALGHLVFKYQLLYVYFHPNESAGQTWPMVYNRVTLGLLIFQLTMLGFFMLRHAYFFGVLLAPLPAGTAWFWYWTTNTYRWTAQYMPLELLRTIQETELSPEYSQQQQHDLVSSASQQQGYRLSSNSLAALGSDVASPGAAGLDHITLDLTKAVAKDPKKSRRFNNASLVVTTPGGSRRRLPKSVVDDDDYQAIPDRFTDYRQPPMTLYPGVLNSGMRRYCHPAIAGALPTLWLPLKKDDSINVANRRAMNSDEAGRRSSMTGSCSHRPSLTIPSRTLDQPRDYEEGDNLAGGGQDEEDLMDLTEEPESSSSTAVHIHGNEGEHRTTTGTMDGDFCESRYEDDDADDDNYEDALSDITGGPSPPDSPVLDDRPLPQPLPPMSGSFRRNPAVEGISDVYYHHPERRMSSASPKTIHFWAPAAKWALVIAGVGDMQRPAENLSLPQNIALSATGLIWSRYSLVIIPKNYSLFTVNLFVAGTGLTQLYRIFDYRQGLKAQEKTRDSVAAK